MTPAELELQDLAFITEDDLPSDDNEVMETARHKMQMDLLIETLRPWLAAHPDGGYTSSASPVRSRTSSSTSATNRSKPGADGNEH